MSQKKKARVIMLGTRGTLPITGDEFKIYGGDTACVLVQMGGRDILLDAGTGIQKSTPFLENKTGPVSILLSHAHIDHIMGLLIFSWMNDPGKRIDIYGATFTGLTIRQQLNMLMGQPLWPVGQEEYRAKIRFRNITCPFQIGDVDVQAMIGNHPGGSLVYRLTYQDVSIVYCTDFEHNSEITPRLIEFAKGCSLLIYDAGYTDKEYVEKTGWGHSTCEEGIRVGRRAGAGQVSLFHHGRSRTDVELDALEKSFPDETRAAFARNNEVIML